MTSESSHCDYSGLRCNVVLKALNPEVQKGPFCIPYSLFFHFSSQSRFFSRSISSAATCWGGVFNNQGQKGIESVKGTSEKPRLAQTNVHVVINTRAMCTLPRRDKGGEVHKQPERLSLMVVDNGNSSPTCSKCHI